VNKRPRLSLLQAKLIGSLLATAVLGTQAACDPDRNRGDISKLGAGAVSTTNTPQKVVASRYVQSTPQMVDQGRASFGACMGCHGERGDGRVGIGPRLDSETFLAAASDEFLVNNIKNGRTGTTMIPWGGTYSDAQIESVVAYLRSLRSVEPATLDESPLQGTVATGEEIYRTICASCHGRSGGGYQETANGTGIGRRTFLEKASNGFIRHIVNDGKKHTAMKGFNKNAPASVANLTEQEIDSVIAYLRANAW
jgi:mono/diheme cytochrome c family protein